MPVIYTTVTSFIWSAGIFPVIYKQKLKACVFVFIQSLHCLENGLAQESKKEEEGLKLLSVNSFNIWLVMEH